MKTIKELTNLGVAAARAVMETSGDRTEWMCLSESDRTDQQAREAFARAVREQVMADHPSADVPTWRPN